MYSSSEKGRYIDIRVDHLIHFTCVDLSDLNADLPKMTAKIASASNVSDIIPEPTNTHSALSRNKEPNTNSKSKISLPMLIYTIPLGSLLLMIAAA